MRTVYPAPHDSRSHVDHMLRVTVSIQIARSLGEFDRVADLSCGDGVILSNLEYKDAVFGDFASGRPVTGPLEQTLEELAPVGLYVCTETLEHLDDPDAVLKQIRSKTDRLLLSTPVAAWNDPNPEHYWAWGRVDVEEMLQMAGFQVLVYSSLDFRPAGSQYCFGIWGCK